MTKEKIANALKLISELPELPFGNDVYFVPEEYESTISKYGIPVEEYGKFLKLQFKNYFKEENLKYAKIIDSEIRYKDVFEDILVLDGSGTIIKYDSSINEFECFGKENNSLLFLFRNIIAYYKLFNFLKSDSFSDYFNDANNEIVIYSSVNGVFRITYETIPLLEYEDDITAKVGQLIEVARPVEVRSFFKNAIFALSNNTGKIALDEIIKQSDTVISITNRDYELVSKQFDFNKFRDSLYKEKEKYFLNIREVVNKIFSQAVGIPISISATVFATYKVSDDVFMLLIVLLAFLIYAGFYVKIQLIYKSDIEEIEKNFQKDFDIITLQSGLQQAQIQSEKQKIERKILSSISMVNWLIAIILLLALIVCIYILYEILFSEAFRLVRFLFYLL